MSSTPRRPRTVRTTRLTVDGLEPRKLLSTVATASPAEVQLVNIAPVADTTTTVGHGGKVPFPKPM
jgi:hypothetical protein